MYLNQQQFDSYYNGCCNGTLWPLFHSMSDRAVYTTENWQVKSFEKSSRKSFNYNRVHEYRPILFSAIGLHPGESVIC